MTILIIIVVAIGVIYYFSRGRKHEIPTATPRQEIEVEPRQKRNYSEIRKFESEKLFFKLKGVAYDNRTDAYDEVETGDIVFTRFDYNNKHDKNALGVYTKSGKLLGYIERDQRRLIKTLRNNPSSLTYIAEKIFVPPNGEYKNPYRGIEIEIWVGFSESELAKEKQRRIEDTN